MRNHVNDRVREGNWQSVMNTSVNKIHCQTVYPDVNQLSPIMAGLLITANFLLCVANVLVNFLLILALRRANNFCQVSARLFLTLSASDACVGLILQPIVAGILFEYHFPVQNCSLKIAGQALSFLLPQFSGVMILIISYDRWTHMKYVASNNRYLNVKKAYILIGLNFISSIVTSITSALSSLYDYIAYFNLIIIFVDGTVFFTAFFLYLSAYLSVKQRRKRIDTVVRFTTSPSRALTRLSSDTIDPSHRNIGLAKTIAFILASALFCFMPYFVTGICWSWKEYYLKKKTSESTVTIMYWSFIFVYSSSFFNAVVLIHRSKPVRQSVVAMLHLNKTTVQKFSLKIEGNDNYKRIDRQKRMSWTPM